MLLDRVVWARAGRPREDIVTYPDARFRSSYQVLLHVAERGLCQTRSRDRRDYAVLFQEG